MINEIYNTEKNNNLVTSVIVNNLISQLLTNYLPFNCRSGKNYYLQLIIT